MENLGGVYFLCFRVRRIRTKLECGILIAMGCLTLLMASHVPPINRIMWQIEAATMLEFRRPPIIRTEDVLRIQSFGPSTTIDLDNGKLRLTFDKNGESKLPVEVVVDGHTLLADHGRSEIAQMEEVPPCIR